MPHIAISIYICKCEWFTPILIFITIQPTADYDEETLLRRAMEISMNSSLSPIPSLVPNLKDDETLEKAKLLAENGGEKGEGERTDASITSLGTTFSFPTAEEMKCMCLNNPISGDEAERVWRSNADFVFQDMRERSSKYLRGLYLSHAKERLSRRLV